MWFKNFYPCTKDLYFATSTDQCHAYKCIMGLAEGWWWYGNLTKMQLVLLLKVVIILIILTIIISNTSSSIITIFMIIISVIGCVLSQVFCGRYCGANIIAMEWAFNGLASVIKFFALFKENS